jgi:parallel beta-helix repeat protein
MQNKLLALFLVLISAGTIVFYIQYFGPIGQDGIAADLSGSKWILEDKIYDFPEGLYVPSYITLEISPGATLRFGQNTILSAHSLIKVIGTKEKPIKMTSLTRHGWRGIRLMGTETYFQTALNYKAQWPMMLQKSNFFQELEFNQQSNHFVFENVIVENVTTAGPRENLRYNYMGALEILGTRAQIRGVTFQNIDRIGAIRAYNSAVHLDQNVIAGSLYRKGIHINNSIALLTKNRITKVEDAMICRDGMWILGSVVIATRNEIHGQGDDAFDLKGSAALIFKNNMSGNKDEGIDVDHDSSAILIENKIDSSESGIQVSGQSEAILKNNLITNNKTAIQVRGQSDYLNLNNMLLNNIKDFELPVTELRSEEDQGWRETGDMKGLLIKKEPLKNINEEDFPIDIMLIESQINKISSEL